MQDFGKWSTGNFSQKGNFTRSEFKLQFAFSVSEAKRKINVESSKSKRLKGRRNQTQTLRSRLIKGGVPQFEL